MSVQVEKLEAKDMVKLVIEVPAEDFAKACQDAYNKQKKDFSMPGFRKGKVPMNMIEKMYGAGVFYEDAANAIMPLAYSEAAAESGLDIVSRPEIEVTQIEKGKPFIFTAEVAVKPEITLGEYKGIEVTKIDCTVTEEDIEEEIQRELKKNARQVSVEREIVEGDTAAIDYVGSVDGVEFEGGSTNGEGSKLEIGSGSFIPGFEEQLVGHKVGENFDINVTFPEDYQAEELAGKDAVFNITVNGIYEIGEFNDAFVAENLKAYATTVDGYKKYLADTNYEDRVKVYVSNYIDDNSSLSSYPKKYLTQLKALKMYSDQSSFEYMNQMYQQFYGAGYPNFQAYIGMSDEDYQVAVEESAMKSELTTLALQAIAEKEGITVSDDDIKAFVEKVYGEGSYDSTLESYGKNYLAQTALQDKVGNYLVDNATVK